MNRYQHGKYFVRYWCGGLNIQQNIKTSRGHVGDLQTQKNIELGDEEKEHSCLPCVPEEQRWHDMNDGGRQCRWEDGWKDAELSCILEEDPSRNLCLNTQLLFGSLLSIGLSSICTN